MDRMEKMLSQILAGQEAARIQNDARLAGHDASIKNLEIQMGQLASQLNVMATHISKGSLPSDTIPNPRNKGQEECKVITLRSGKRVDNEPKPQGVNKES